MDGFKAGLKDSIQIRLSFWICVAIAFVGVAGGALSFCLSQREFSALQDDLLVQMSETFDRYDLSARLEDARATHKQRRRDQTIFVQALDSTAKPVGQHLDYPPDLKEGFQTLVLGKRPYRVLVKTMATGERVAFAFQIDFRDDLSQEMAIRTLMPFFILLPVLLLVIGSLVRTQFQPIAALTDEIERRSDGDLHPLTTTDVPREVRAFVAAINGMLQRVAQAVEAQKRFIADAAHELRTPLTALSLQAELLEGGEMSAECHGLLASLRQGIERGRLLVEQLLNYARIQSADAKVRTVGLRDAIRQTLQDLMPLADSKSIDVGIKSEGDAHILGDPAEVQLILRNLISNAIRFTPSQGQVDAWVESTPEASMLHVEDTGPGIPEAEYERVLDPFYRILGNEENGSGLGLAIVKSAVDRLGGWITFAPSSIAPTGLRVTVGIPAGAL